MIQSDSELIEKALELTDYGNVMSTGKVSPLLDTGKDEIRSHLGDPTMSFYEVETIHATRALFWFTCIAMKVKAGEIASVDLTVGSIRASKGSGSPFDWLFRSFDNHMRRAERNAFGAAATTQIERADERTYGE